MNMNLGDTRLLIKAGREYGLLRNQMAYVLATAYHETAHTMKPVREMGGEKYLRSKKYYPHVGMGYVQITWEYNSAKASRELGVDFVSNPKLLLEPRYAAPIIIAGMVEGWFTGKKLSDYITLQKSDFKGARRIVNGTDKADLIAGYASEYDKLLLAEGYGVDQVIEAPANDIVPVPVEPEPVAKSKRFWTWLTAAALPALGLLDWRVQMASVVVVGGISIYAIYSMPSVKAKLSKLIEAL
ncbi:hypothetical protein [Paenochrobactrum pullorum]|uniref:hypothetical protein n=1 Tax=Paenochrobactrum pullorum TaxID=1324351 RepID=UPI0035BBBF2F